MPQKIVINADNVGDLLVGYGAGARVEVERSSTGGGVGFAQIATVPLVAGVEQYEYWDAAGAVTDFYRVRFTTSTGTTPSSYSAEFRGGQSLSYATLDDLREYIKLADNTRDNLLTDLLVRATSWLNEKCHRDFFRHPAVAGTEVRLVSPTRRDSLLLDYVSMTMVEIAAITGGTFVALATTDYVNEPPFGEWYIGSDGGQYQKPYEELKLSGVGAYFDWRSGFSTGYSSGWSPEYMDYRTANYGTVRLTGAFGWPAVPIMIQQACLDLAREWYRQGPGGGGPIGVNQFGTPLFLQGMPTSAKDAVLAYRRSFGAV